MRSLSLILRMAWREGRAAGRRMLLLTAAISIGVGALVAIESFTDNLQVAVEQQSRSLLGGDFALSSRAEPTPGFLALLDSLSTAAGVDRPTGYAEVTSFAGMAYVTRTSGARLVRVSAISGGYPFYGVVHTAPADRWPRLQAGEALVDPSFLTAMGAEVGDTMALGEARFVIAGSVTSFPGDVGIRSAFGPRVFIPGARLGDTKLLGGFGARAEHEWYLKVADTLDAKDFAATWRPKVNKERGRFRTAAEEEQDLQQSLERLGRYLGLVALIALLLGGIGVGSAVQVFLRRKRDGIAVLRCLGATSGQVFGIYLLQAAVMGLAGSALGVLLGLGLQFLMPAVFGAFIPLDVQVRPSLAAVLTGLGVGLWVAVIFALLPLLQVRAVPPLAVLRRDVDEGTRRGFDGWSWLARALLALSVVGLAALQVRDLAQGAGFAAGVAGALLVLWGAAVALTRALRRWFPHRLPYTTRQGLANLYRPANQTVAVVLALGFGAFLLGALAVMQHNLLRQLALDGGAGRPNLVLFDIQPDQRADVEQLLRDRGHAVQPAVPIVPMRLRAINGRPVSQLIATSDSLEALRDSLGEEARPRRRERGGEGQGPERWALRREYRSTYRDSSVGSEKLVVGDWWQPGAGAAPPYPVSLETGIAGDLGVTIRDTVTWDVQGVPVVTVVKNLREVNWARFEPNFFAVFPEGPLAEAPQGFVLLTRIGDAAEIGRVQRAVVERHPNVTSVDLTSVQQTIERIVDSVTLAINFMAFFSLATGVVVLVGALATSRFQRMREAALLKTLGATRRQVVRVMVTEYAALGILAAVVATGLSAAGGWAIMKWVFELPFTVPWLGFGVLALVLVALTVITGLWNSLDVFRRTPVEVLRAD